MAKASFKSEVAKVAKALREAKQLRQTEAADYLGISTVALSKIENGHSMPSLEVLEGFRVLYGIDPFVLAWAQSDAEAVADQSLAKAVSNLRRAITKRTESTLR